MRRILVTGATGNVGGATLRLMGEEARAGLIELRASARSREGADKLKREGFHPVNLDFDAPATLRPALEGVDTVFLSTGYSVDMLVHSKRLLDAAKAEGVRHIVHLGAMARDDTPYAHLAWHQLVERATEAMGFSWTHLRPNFFMDTLWSAFLQRPDRVIGFVGDRRISWVCTDDIAAVAAAALLDPRAHHAKVYQLAVEALSYAEIAALLTEMTGRNVECRNRPAVDLAVIQQKLGAEPIYSSSLAQGMAAIERGDEPLSDAVFDTVSEVTGHKPVDWREFVRRRIGNPSM